MLDVNQDGAATPQDAIVILRHLSLVSGPALTAGVITGGAQIDPIQIKTYLNGYTPGTTITSAGVSSSTDLSAVSSQPSAPNTSDPFPRTDGAPALSIQDSALPSAIADTQLSSASVQSRPWVSQFVGVSTPKDKEVFVTL